MPRLSSVQLCGAFLLLSSLGACGRGIAPDVIVVSTDVTLNTEFILAPSQTGNVAGTDLAVRLDSVTTDSRCPLGVLCIWAGDANIHLSVLRGKRAPTPVVLHLTNMPRSVVDGSEIIELVSLEPIARQQTQIKPSDYRARLVIRTKA
jgi:hypothetical protein